MAKAPWGGRNSDYRAFSVLDGQMCLDSHIIRQSSLTALPYSTRSFQLKRNVDKNVATI